MRRRSFTRSPALRRSTDNDAGETQLDPLARIALDCVETGLNGPSTGQRWRVRQRRARVSCGVSPLRCIVGSGHAPTRATAASRRSHRSGMGAGNGDNMRCGVAGRGCKAGLGPSRTGNVSGAPQGWVLVACLLCRSPPAAGSLGDHGPPRAAPALHHLHMRRLAAHAAHFRPWNAPGKLRQIKHLRLNRGPAHYRGQRSIGGRPACRPRS